MSFQNEGVERPKFLADIPLKFFKEPYISDECSYCKTRMIHPELGLYICPNEKCQFKYKSQVKINKSKEIAIY